MLPTAPTVLKKQMADTYFSGMIKGNLVFVSPHLLPVFVSIKISKTVIYCNLVASLIIDLYRAPLTPDFGESCNTLIKIVAISLWLISLAFGIKSALIALQVYKWTRAYIDRLNDPSRPWPRCGVLIRLLLFLGVDIYNPPNTMAQMTSALQISVCALFGGIAVVFHTIDTNAAIAVDVTVVVALGIFFLLSTIPRAPERSVLFSV